MNVTSQPGKKTPQKTLGVVRGYTLANLSNCGKRQFPDEFYEVYVERDAWKIMVKVSEKSFAKNNHTLICLFRGKKKTISTFLRE